VQLRTVENYQAALVLMLVSEVRVRWTGHFLAISKSFERCSLLNGPANSISSSIRSIFLSLISHAAQSSAWILKYRSRTVTSWSGQLLRWAYIVTVRRRSFVVSAYVLWLITAYIYELAPEAEELFPKVYEPVLGQLLDVLSEKLRSEESKALLRSVGRRIAEGQTPPTDGVRARLEAAVGVLNEVGGLA
jgi:hypothetical protein